MKKRGQIALSAMAILALAIGIPILILGLGVSVKFIKLINTPVIGGSIPIWALFVGILFLGLIIRRLR